MRLQTALAGRDNIEIQTAAECLDRIAGPHIAFEEEWLYPLVAKFRGKETHQHMTGEHADAVAALTDIRSTNVASSTTEQQVVKWQDHLQTGLDHVITCGTLLSHLTRLEELQREQMLEQLLGLRTKGCLWTEFVAQKA